MKIISRNSQNHFKNIQMTVIKLMNKIKHKLLCKGSDDFKSSSKKQCQFIFNLSLDMIL